MQKGRVKAEKRTDGIAETICSFLMSVWCFCALIAVPLYAPDGYVEIGLYKWQVFIYPSLIILPLSMLLTLTGWLGKRKKAAGDKRPLPVLIALFAAACVVTAILASGRSSAESSSDLLMPAKWNVTGGLYGWYMGLLAQLAFAAAAICLTYVRPKAKLLNIALVPATAFIFLMGLLNRFMIDPLGMFKRLDNYHYTQYLSTIGQNTWYSSYLVIMMSAGLYFYYTSEKKNIRTGAAVYTILCSASLITQGSDCALLAVGAAMAFMFAYSFDNKEKLKRWLELCLMILLAWRLVGLLQLAAGERAVDAGGLMTHLTQAPYLWILPVAVLILRVLVSGKNVEVKKFKKLRTACLLMIPAAILLGITYIVLNTLGCLPQAFSSDNGYLLFDDEWGSARGIIWKSSVKVITENIREHPLRLLFGEGPDAFTAAAYEAAGDALRAKWPGKLVPNAHNEWLNMLINYGLIGGGLYLAIFVLVIKNCLSAVKTKPGLMMPLLCLTAYMVHNFFCYQQVICTAPAFILIGMVCREGYGTGSKSG